MSFSSEVDSQGICWPREARRTFRRTRLKASSMRVSRAENSRSRFSVYSPCLPPLPSAATLPGEVA